MTRLLTLLLLLGLALPASAQSIPIPIPIPNGRVGDGIEILSDIINIVNSRRSHRERVPERRRMPVPLPPSTDGRPGGYDVITAGGRPARLAPESMPLTINAQGRKQVVNRAVESWNGAGLGTLFVVVDGPADLDIDWSGSNVTPGARAETRMATNGSRIVPTGVAVNTRGRSEDWLVKVLAHEFGHVLGLDHSAASGDLMYRSEGPGRAELSQRDRDMLHWLYSQPDYTPVVGRTRSGNVAGGVLRFNH